MRRTQLLMDNWLFTGPDNQQTAINLPHTWNAIDGQDGGNDYYRGCCVYEKFFDRPDFTQDEQVYLQFQGVNASATVIFNGKEICTHNNGYSTFRAEITQLIDNENHLKVLVDNSKNDTVYPQVADFTFYGGIYRDVEILIVSKNHFDLDYYGGNGLKVMTVFTCL